jgi:hypothetical protein
LVSSYSSDFELVEKGLILLSPKLDIGTIFFSVLKASSSFAIFGTPPSAF